MVIFSFDVSAINGDLIDSSLEFTMKNLNQGLSNDKEWKTQYEFYDEHNTCGLYQVKYGKNPGTFYYLQSEGKRIKNPAISAKWRNTILSKQGHILQTLKDMCPPVHSMRPLPVAAASDSAHATRPSPATTLNPTPAKRS